MSTRYVWDRYDVLRSIRESTFSGRSSEIIHDINGDTLTYAFDTFYVGLYRNLENTPTEDDPKVVLSDRIDRLTVTAGQDTNITLPEDCYFVFSKSMTALSSTLELEGTSSITTTPVYFLSPFAEGPTVYFSQLDPYSYWRITTGNTNISFTNYYRNNTTASKGNTLLDTVSGTSQGPYPPCPAMPPAPW